MKPPCPCSCEHCHEENAELAKQVEVLEARNAELASQVEALKAKVSELTQEKYGKRGERGEQRKKEEEVGLKEPEEGAEVRRRGQQPGSRGHGRRSYEHLPTEDRILKPGNKELVCSTCGAPYEELGEDRSEQLEWEVVVRRVVTHRPSYRRRCTCPKSRAVVQVAAPSRVIPKGRLSAGLLAWLVVMKFELRMPGQRVLGMLSMMGLEMAPGSLCGIYDSLAPLVEPLAEAIRARNRISANLHVDETGWKVFYLEAEVEGKGRRWYVWVLIGADTTSYLIKPSRGAKVLAEELGIDLGAKAPITLPGGRQLVLLTDFHSAYQSIGARVEGIVNSWCWVHMRRYFVKARDHHPACESWAKRWLKRIGELFKTHERWVLAEAGSAAEADCYEAMWKVVAEMDEARKTDAAWRGLPKPARKVLGTLEHEWTGLLVALQPEHRGMAIENNVSERGVRGPVLGRKNHYGSGSARSAVFTANIWTVFATMKQAGWNPLRHFEDYLLACEQAGGCTPVNLDRFLPWLAGEADRLRWASDTS